MGWLGLTDCNYKDISLKLAGFVIICGWTTGIGVVTGIEVLLGKKGGIGTGIVIVAGDWAGNMFVTGVGMNFQ